MANFGSLPTEIQRVIFKMLCEENVIDTCFNFDWGQETRKYHSRPYQNYR
jgi:hypothetical protein